MLTKEKAHDIFTRLKKFSTADEVEAQIYGGHSALTRFANNTIHQNVAEQDRWLSVRVAQDQKTARATTNRFDPDSIRRAGNSLITAISSARWARRPALRCANRSFKNCLYSAKL